MKRHRGCGEVVTLHASDPLRYYCQRHGLVEWEAVGYDVTAAVPAPVPVTQPRPPVPIVENTEPRARAGALF